jgi:hypothetical protein
MIRPCSIYTLNVRRRHTLLIIVWLLLVQCSRATLPPEQFLTLPAGVYYDKVRGSWQATLVANHTGLLYEGKYLQDPSPEDTIELVLLDEWSTDDDTLVEWVDLHILETHGLDPTYAQIRDEWVDHLNNDIWVSALRARQLMDEGVLPPDTGSAALNPEGAWSIGAQLQTEVFGLISPGLPDEASRRAEYFARVTNSGPAVEASAFYTALYAQAFFEEDIPTLISHTQARFPPDSTVYRIVTNVRMWHQQHPDDWRQTRRLIRDSYDTDPQWWASKVNFASTLMALLYGEGKMMRTMTIAALAGWDADNNVTTSAGLLGIIHGYQGLPEPFRVAGEIYFNEDVSGDLPRYQTVPEIARRTQALAEAVILQAGGQVGDGVYIIPKKW